MKWPAWTNGTSAAQVLGIGAKMVRRVRLFKKTRPIGKVISMLRLTPTTETVPPAAAHPMASVTVSSAPMASMTDSAPRPPVASRTWADAGATRAVDDLRAEAFGPSEALGDHVDRQDAGRTEELGTLQRHDADRAEADDDHGCPRMNVGPLSPEVARWEDVGQEDRVLVADIPRDFEGECVGEGHGEGLALPAG